MRALAFASMFLVCGCSKLMSSELKTAGMSAHISVSADGTGGTTAAAVLNVGDNPLSYVELSTGDTLTASTGSKSEAMGRHEIFNIVTYTAAFTGADAEGTEYTVALTRADDTSAPSTTVTIPAPITVTPPSSSSLSRANDDLVFTWTSAGSDQVRYDVSGSCLTTQSSVNVASGTTSATVAKGTLVKTTGGDGGMVTNMDTCQATVTVHRSRAGTLDSHYGHGGSAVGEQVRSFTFTSTP